MSFLISFDKQIRHGLDTKERKDAGVLNDSAGERMVKAAGDLAGFRLGVGGGSKGGRKVRGVDCEGLSIIVNPF